MDKKPTMIDKTERVAAISKRLTEIYSHSHKLSRSTSEPIVEIPNKEEFDERCKHEQIEAESLRKELRQLASDITVYMFDCSTDGRLHLLVPNKDNIPEAARNLCQGEWKFNGWLHDFTGTGVHIGFHAEDALACIYAQGYFIFGADWQSEVTIPGNPPRKL
jgi:hypothetical protein